MNTTVLEDSRRPTTLDPADAIRAAHVLRERGYFRVPLALYDLALSHRESDDARLGKGISLGKLGLFEQARATLAPLFADGPARRGEAYYAYVLERTGALDEAIVRYDRALAGPEGADAWTMGHRAYCLEKRGDDAAARAAYAAAIVRHPTDTWVRKRLVLFLWRRGQRSEARQELESARKAAPDPLLFELNALEIDAITGDELSARERLRRIARAASNEAHRLVADVVAWGAAIDRRPDRQATWRELVERAERLSISVHRDFDDVEALVVARGESVERWRALVSALVK